MPNIIVPSGLTGDITLIATVNDVPANEETGNVQNIDIATGNANFHVVAGDVDMNGLASELVISPQQSGFYDQTDGDIFASITSFSNGTVSIKAYNATASTNIVIQPGIATINKNGTGNKSVVTVRPEDNFANDAAAATGGIALNEFYHTAGVLKIRIV